MPQTTNPPEILLLSESEASSVIDRRALREAGYANPKVMTSGILAARYLSERSGKNDAPAAVVVCSNKLDDMDGEQFCAIIRQHPLLMNLPVLLLLPNDSEAEQLKALGCGASAILGRPYSVGSLREQIIQFSSIQNSENSFEAGCIVDTGPFEAALASYGLLLRPERNPDDYFRAGMKCLEDKKWNVAICAFQYALQNANTAAEAQLGMAAAYKGKGDMARFRLWLARAAETLVRAKRWHLARTSFARLLQQDPEAKNPFLAEARRLIRQKEYDNAADILAQVVSIIPKAKSGEQLASVCLGAEDSPAMLRALAQSLEREDKNYDYLIAEIRQSLEIMTREREDRQKAMAAERKWQLSRQLAEKKAAKSVQSDIPPQTLPPVEALNIEEEPDREKKSSQPTFFETNLTEEDETEEIRGPVLAPLTKNEATSELFGKSPKINEFISVVKLTWKLAKRAGKKEKDSK